MFIIVIVNVTFSWSKEDEARLNELNVTTKLLSTPQGWTWAAKEGTPQYEYNHKRLQFCVQKELTAVIKHCDRCKSTGILVGLNQIHSADCHDCIMFDRERSKAAKTEAWEQVRPATEYPKRVEPGHEHEDLPELYPGDQAVIAPVHPFVTVTKNFIADKKFRQESISLKQDAASTWCEVLPRADLKQRFVVIERTSKDNTKRHIVANPQSVSAWLKYLFQKNKEFQKMRADAELIELDDNALAEAVKLLDSQVELAEVLIDVEESEEDEDKTEDEEENNRQAVDSDAEPMQAAMESGLSKHHVFTFDKYPQLYLKAKELLKIKEDSKMDIVVDRSVRVPTYNTSANIAFPHLYPTGEKSPLDFGNYKLSRYLLKKQSLFAFKMADGTYRWEYSAADIHMAFQYARLIEQTVHANVGYYLSQHPDSAHLPIDAVLTAFKNGFNDDGLLDSQLPGLSSIMTQLPHSRQRWTAERLGIEAISRDLQDPNLFLTLNQDPRACPDVRRLVYELEHGHEMPRDHPFEIDTERYTELMSKFAPQISIYLCRKVKIFLKAFLCDICGVPEDELKDDWTQHNPTETGWYWAR